MAIKANSTELDIARRARSTARERMANHIGSPNLNRSGTQKGLVAPTPQVRPKSAAALRREYGNGREKSVQQVEREVVGDSIMLRGKFRAVETAQGNVAQKKQVLKRLPTFTVPMARDSRPTNKDGATSFHFKHEAIAKTMSEKTSGSGTKTRKNAGREHSKYLERDSAVARSGEAIDRSSLSSDEKDAAGALGRAAAGGLYIEREEALAHQENGVAVIYSNISQDADERHRFWGKVEKHEVEPKPDHLKFITGEDPDFWEAVRTDSRCPEQLATGIQEADPSKPCLVRTDDNKFIREIMADHGWAPPSPRRPNESPAEKSERERTDKDNSKGAHCVDGRGGRIQNRVVGELPYEVSHEQRVRILRRFTAHFEERSLPYVAVMHAPDHSNHKKNWHFHLVYYDRPCGRFTGKSADYMKEPKGNWRALAMHNRKVKAFASGALEAYVGQWDFTVPMTYKTNCSHTRTSYPFAQEKDRACTERDYPWKLRKELAEFTNDELELAGSGRRVDPRRFSEMGIDKEAEEHLGTRSAQMECLGIATPQGVENEHRQWHFTLDTIENNFMADERNRVNEERRWRQKLEYYHLSPRDRIELSEMATRWTQTQAEANEQAAIASELAHQLERVQSRAKKVQKTCKRHLTAIDSGRANKRQSDNKSSFEARLSEATNHLSGLTIIMASEIVQEKRSRDEATRLTEEAGNIRTAINARLRDELAAMVAASTSTKGKETDEPRLSTDTVPAAEHHEDKIMPAFDHSHLRSPLRQSDVELFMQGLVRKNRRIVEEGKYLVPFNPDEDEKDVISAPNYADHQHRLIRLKAAQDAHIDRLSRYIHGNPEVIEVVPGKAGAGDIRYKLLSDNEILQCAFKGFAADDDQIKAAIESALKARQNGRLDPAPLASANNDGRAPTAVPAPAAPPVMRGPPAGTSADSIGTPSTLTIVMRKIDELAAAARPIFCETKDGRAFYSLAKEDMRVQGLIDRDLQAAAVQTRLRGIHHQHDSEIKRLVGFIGHSPARATISPRPPLPNSQPVVGLAPTAPPDLQALSQKYAEHSVAQVKMTDALRQAGTKPQRTNAGELKPFADATEPQRATAESASGKASKVEQQKAGPSGPAATRPETAPSAGINPTAPVQLSGHRPARSDQTGEPAPPRPSEIQGDDGKADGPVIARFDKTKEQPDELLRRWTGEDEAPADVAKRQLKGDRLDGSKDASTSLTYIEAVDGKTLSAHDRHLPHAEPEHQFAAAVANSGESARSSRASLIKAWDDLGSDATTTFDEIEHDHRALVRGEDGNVLFARSNEAPAAHRLCLAAFQRTANRLFVEQEARMQDEQIRASLEQKSRGIV